MLYWFKIKLVERDEKMENRENGMEEQVEIILRGGQFKLLLERQFLNIREKYGLKRIELEVLFFLSKCGTDNTSTDICRHLKLNKGHVSQAVDSLCRMGYLETAVDSEDRRYIHFTVTAKADGLVQDMAERWKVMNRKIFEGISEEELKTFKEVSARIGANMSRLAEQD